MCPCFERLDPIPSERDGPGPALTSERIQVAAIILRSTPCRAIPRVQRRVRSAMMMRKVAEVGRRMQQAVTGRGGAERRDPGELLDRMNGQDY